LDKVQALTGDSDAQRQKTLTPYRVIADHSRSIAFLIADGVVPGIRTQLYLPHDHPAGGALWQHDRLE